MLIELQILLEEGYDLVSGGTENHLVLVNLRNKVNVTILVLTFLGNIFISNNFGLCHFVDTWSAENLKSAIALSTV